jgi:hypothetical protein
MSLHDPKPCGGRVVADLSMLSPAEALLVGHLRLWFAGPEGQAEVWNDLALRLGPGAARHALGLFEDLLDLTVRHARRPLSCRHAGCAAVSADEAVFAHFVQSAATAAREDAMLIAVLLVRADVAPVAAALAEEAGLAFLRAARSEPGAGAGAATTGPPAPPARLH